MRQERWKELGYNDEQIERHLEFERYKSKLNRDRKKRNNEKNKDLIKQIKKDLLGKTFESKFRKCKIWSINPTLDGRGFWCHTFKKFNDGSGGDFREFCYFDEYDKKELIENLG